MLLNYSSSNKTKRDDGVNTCPTPIGVNKSNQEEDYYSESSDSLNISPPRHNLSHDLMSPEIKSTSKKEPSRHNLYHDLMRPEIKSTTKKEPS